MFQLTRKAFAHFELQRLASWLWYFDNRLLTSEIQRHSCFTSAALVIRHWIYTAFGSNHLSSCSRPKLSTRQGLLFLAFQSQSAEWCWHWRRECKSHKQISEELKSLYPGVWGLLKRRVLGGSVVGKTYTYTTSLLSHEDWDQIVSSSIAKVCYMIFGVDIKPSSRMPLQVD